MLVGFTIHIRALLSAKRMKQTRLTYWSFVQRRDYFFVQDRIDNNLYLSVARTKEIKGMSKQNISWATGFVGKYLLLCPIKWRHGIKFD
jgi:hypothetical protein